MQIPSLTSNVATTLGANVRADGSQQGIQQSNTQEQFDQALEVTGNTSSSEAVQPVENSLQEAAVSSAQAAPSTQVVTSTEDVLGTTLGLNIDVTV